MSQKTPNTTKKYISKVSATLEGLPIDNLAQVVKLLEEARLKAKRVFIFGNRGSAATASPFATDLSKGSISKGKPKIKTFALTNNIPPLTAWANDTVYENIFAEQLEYLVEPRDMAIGISGSGNYPNVLNGIKMAKAKRATTFGFIGFDGGKLRKLVDIQIMVLSHSMEQVEDIHLLPEHVITTCLREGA